VVEVYVSEQGVAMHIHGAALIGNAKKSGPRTARFHVERCDPAFEPHQRL
jgi:hypothetical protein